MRPIWTGAISFGLINIPVALFPAASRDEVKFRLLRAGDLSPVNYKRVAEADGKEVPWDQIVKGYEYEKGRFVVIKEEDFKRVDVEAAQTVDIMDFVRISEINPMFFYKPYYMKPAKGGAKAYALLRETLSAEGKVAMAKTLVSQMTVKWNPHKYKDEYKSSILHLIEKKIESGGHPVEGPKKTAKRPTNVVDLADVLRRSLEETAGRREKKPSPKSHRKKAA